MVTRYTKSELQIECDESLRLHVLACYGEMDRQDKCLADADRLNLSRQKRIETLETERISATADPPKFAVGKRYRHRNGQISDPLVASKFPLWACEHSRSFTVDGREFPDRESQWDLTPGAVELPPTWTPPASLPDGEYLWCGGALTQRPTELTTSILRGPLRAYRDWKDPPKRGRWKVKDGAAEFIGAE